MRAAAVLNDVNWCAFALALISPKYTVERALDYVCGVTTQHNNRCDLTDSDTEDMIKLRKQKIPYSEIGEIYGMDQSAVHRRVKKYKERRSYDHIRKS
ncbi:hypothetical protein SPSPH_045730 [Sporomusa sphaeroides DSM 2875]|uniref:Sigma-70, region 4 n=1 Tax=Sporomusa sphaeroides DSM 2875 TaxID=1337886 RepID=A0ABM9W0V6_9FIRM|nr:hypothetical protein SPSPH_27990 [Sporomusa sphaeroides DSM 2875]CVK18501.1 hypothetical protein SSPH_01139 [Sporomusa sphaeroides DSM 2875]